VDTLHNQKLLIQIATKFKKRAFDNDKDSWKAAFIVG
jgi:hypothetical protein